MNFEIYKLYKYTGTVHIFDGIWECTRKEDGNVYFREVKSGLCMRIFNDDILYNFEPFTPVSIKWKTKYLGLVKG